MPTQPSYNEYIEYIAPDGAVYPFYVPNRIGRWVFTDTGWGLPPINYITQRGPFQHGETVKDFFLTPRTVQLLIRQQFCNREEYWSGRAALLNAIRPNRQPVIGGVTPGVLQRRLPDGSKRCLDVFITQGPVFEPRKLDQWDEWAFQEVLRFTAYNPVVYDPVQQELDFTATDPELIFPITFPITFGSLEINQDLTYLGTWPEFPIIYVYGPISSLRIENQTTGEFIQFDYNVQAGDIVVFDLRYGHKTVTLLTSLPDDEGIALFLSGGTEFEGTNLIGSVSTDSDLGTFHLEPAPGAPQGMNTIIVTGTSVTEETRVVFTYHHRYIGI